MKIWKCKECGKEVTIWADVVGTHRVFLDKQKRAIDYEDWVSLDLPDYKIRKVECKNCGCHSTKLEDVAEWGDE